MEKDWGFSHVALGVKDLDKLVDYYQSKGIGVHQPIRPPAPGAKSYGDAEFVTLNYGRVSEKPTAVKEEDVGKRMTFVQVGSLQLEVGRRPTTEIGTCHHVCFNVEDIMGETAPLIEKGCQIPFALIKDTLLEENHIETNKFGNVILSLRPGGSKRTERELSRQEKPGVSNWKCCGLGIPVKDLDKTVEYYQSLDIGTLQPEVIFDSSSIMDCKVYGKTPDSILKARTRIVQIASVAYQFIQPLEGEIIYKESLDKRGEGVNDLVFTVDDLDKETAKLAEKGVPVIRSGNPKTGNAFAYFDTRKAGDMMIKLIQAE